MTDERVDIYLPSSAYFPRRGYRIPTYQVEHKLRTYPIPVVNASRTQATQAVFGLFQPGMCFFASLFVDRRTVSAYSSYRRIPEIQRSRLTVLCLQHPVVGVLMHAAPTGTTYRRIERHVVILLLMPQTSRSNFLNVSGVLMHDRQERRAGE